MSFHLVGGERFHRTSFVYFDADSIGITIDLVVHSCNVELATFRIILIFVFTLYRT